jgi:hypothetical protein
MVTPMSFQDLEKKLENKVVCDVLDEITLNAKLWKRGGALIHRVLAKGYLHQFQPCNIREERTPISAESTFGDMRNISKKMYDETLNYIYPIVQSGIYTPQ